MKADRRKKNKRVSKKNVIKADQDVPISRKRFLQMMKVGLGLDPDGDVLRRITEEQPEIKFPAPKKPKSTFFS